eukprot:TRINITY_DN15265_c0_g1_i1.p1 TRINITY_DN15265_c0_g1~~TRINITY_DN15265_c0_g1_i1.p1  ORF type:complete len:452 (-),score=63.97 TRINITY_DN15265_c0_g1_i1:90-1412(-)
MASLQDFISKELPSYLTDVDPELSGLLPLPLPLPQQSDAAALQYHENVDTGVPRTVPLHIGRGLQGFSVHSFGTIVWDRPAFHTKLYIYPVGFKSARQKHSYVSPDIKVTYTSEILDGGDAPLFRVTAEDDPSNYTEARFASTAWKEMMQRIVHARVAKGLDIPPQSKTTTNGNELFGLADKRIAVQIAQLPNADRCCNFDRTADSHPLCIRLPMHIGRGAQGFTLVSLGTVDLTRPQFHTKLHVYPIGFKTTRMKYSYVNPNVKVLYTSEILDGGDSPVFRVSAADDPDHAVETRFPSGAWTTITQRLALARQDTGKKTANSLSGQDMFGLSDKRVHMILSQMAAQASSRMLDSLPPAESMQWLRQNSVLSSSHEPQSLKTSPLASPLQHQQQPPAAAAGGHELIERERNKRKLEHHTHHMVAQNLVLPQLTPYNTDHW